ncbi:aminotransferase GliI-like protein [Xylaria nigripes]|nr:aminotransferase GliI-like protein [Xylaria nigripes]
MATLSKRGTQNVETYAGPIPVSLTEVVDDNNRIDLSFAEIYTIRKESVKVFTDVAANLVTGTARAYLFLAIIMHIRVTCSSALPALFSPDISLSSKCLEALAKRGSGAFEVFLNIHTGIVLVPVAIDNFDDDFGKDLILTLKENPIELMQFCERHDLHLVVDEVFVLSEHGCSDLRQPRKFTSALAIDAAAHGYDASRVHVIWSLSKDLGATGARLGCVVTRNRDVRDSIAFVTHIGVSNLSILFARVLLTSPDLPRPPPTSPDLPRHPTTSTQSSSSTPHGSQSLLGGSGGFFFEANSIEYLPCEMTTFVLARLTPHSKTRDDEKAAVAFYQKAGILFFSAADYYRMPPDFRGRMRISFAP